MWAGRNSIDWKNSVGCKVKFIYDDIEDELTIIDYKMIENNKIILTIYVKGYTSEQGFQLSCDDLKGCKLGVALNLISKRNQYTYNINDIIETKTGIVEILDHQIINRKYLNNKSGYRNIKAYKYKCYTCGDIDIRLENKLISCGCLACNNDKVVKGMNDIATTHPHFIKYFKNIEDAYNYSFGSNKNIVSICPDCGYEKEIIINNLINHSFSCPKCGDSISMPNKIMFNILEQLNLQFKPEYSPKWIGSKRYDFYLYEYNLIIEMDGHFHNIDNPFSGQTKEKSKEIDEYKDRIANDNGIKVIRINCNYTYQNRFEFIKNSILNSELNNMLDLINIDWLKCYEYVLSSRVKEICDLWSNGLKNTREISQKTKLSVPKVIEYLKQGNKLGWCDYGSITIPKYGIKVIAFDVNNNIINNSVSITQMSKDLSKITGINFCDEPIRIRLKNNINLPYKGFYFKYAS